ncbi:MAG: hypothetical protein ACPHSE_03495 [Flavobacteriaceae bacterium]
MKKFKAFKALYRENYLLAAISSLVIIIFVTLINVYYITSQKLNLLWMLILIVALFSPLRFLTSFLAQFPFKRVFESFITGMLIEVLILLLFLLN